MLSEIDKDATTYSKNIDGGFTRDLIKIIICIGTKKIKKMMGSRLYVYRPTVATIYNRIIIEKYLEKYGFELIEISNNQQIFPADRLLGFLQIPFSLKIMELMKLQNATIKIKFITGYSVCARLKK